MESQVPSGQQLNLPDGIDSLYQRRYSDPGRTNRHPQSDEGPKCLRHFSLSTFDDLKNISSGSIRSNVNKILHRTGFTAWNKAKTDQFRRYSLYSHAEGNNLLEDHSKFRTSFLTRTISEKSAGDKSSNVSKMARKRSLTSYMPKNESESFVDPTSKIRYADWSESESCTHSPENVKNTSQLNGGSIPPKCSYRLRENGLIASELVSALGVQIHDTTFGLDRIHQSKKMPRFHSLAPTRNFKTATRSQTSVVDPSDGFYQISSPPESLTQWKKKVLPRRPSQISFELLGNTELHGCPDYSGRLKLCTIRSIVD